MDRKHEILIIDDEAIVGTRLKSSLEKLGFSVKTFTDSSEARELLSTKKFDVIVTDLKMPGIDGMQISKFARERWPGTKIIIISGFATVETARNALKEGAYDFIVKPFKISHLKDIIQSAVKE